MLWKCDIDDEWCTTFIRVLADLMMMMTIIIMMMMIMMMTTMHLGIFKVAESWCCLELGIL